MQILYFPPGQLLFINMSCCTPEPSDSGSLMSSPFPSFSLHQLFINQLPQTVRSSSHQDTVSTCISIRASCPSRLASLVLGCARPFGKKKLPCWVTCALFLCEMTFLTKEILGCVLSLRLLWTTLDLVPPAPPEHIKSCCSALRVQRLFCPLSL